jgi:hypothetical protein
MSRRGVGQKVRPHAVTGSHGARRAAIKSNIFLAQYETSAVSADKPI